MKAILFFDDWMLEQRIGLERVMGKPALVGEPFPDPGRGLLGYQVGSVFHSSRLNAYAMYVSVSPSVVLSDVETGSRLLRLTSEDPKSWPSLQIRDQELKVEGCSPDFVTERELKSFQCRYVTTLENTPMADRGFVGIFSNRAEGDRRMYFGFSEDGLTFEADPENTWMDDICDTWTGVLYEDQRECFHLFGRPGCADRRVCLVTTSDFAEFSSPVTVLQADAGDPVLTEVYGMPSFRYEDMYTGFPQMYYPSSYERRRIKTEGKVEPHLAYSYNSTNWYRTERQPFVPLRSLGEIGGGCAYLNAMVRTSEDKILLYVDGSRGDHASHAYMEEEGLDTDGWFGTLIYELRLDGFSYLASSAREGRLRTKAIIPREPQFTINIRTAPHTSVRVQIIDGGHVEQGHEPAFSTRVEEDPIPGFSFEESIPVSGDHLYASVRWRDRENLAELVGRPVRVEIQAVEAEIYGLRLDHQGYWSHRMIDRL